MKKRFGSALAFLSLVFLSALMVEGNSSPGQSTLPDGIKAIFKQNCSVAGCHTGKYPAAGLSFNPDQLFAAVVDVPSGEVEGLKIVDPSAPAKSYLLAKIKGEAGILGKQMPLNRPPLSEEQIKQIENWIQGLAGESGAPGGVGMSLNSGGGPQLVSAGDGEEAAPQDRRPGSQPQGFSRPAFWGTRLVNLPTTTTPGKGEFLFRVSHRFQPPVSEGWDAFYGLDGPAYILLGFGYGIADNLMLTFGRSRLYQEWEVYANWLILDQTKNSSFPLAAALEVGGSLVGQDEPVGADWSGRFRLNALLSLSYQVSDSLSLLVVPAFSSNTDFWEPDSEGTFALGIGGRFMFLPDLSLIAEWIPALAGYDDITNGWGLGVEKKIGGHVFQIFVTNSIGICAAQFLPGGDLRLADGDFRLGFNIFRTF
jgi:mono/diheme cytochrome c family protein